MAAPDTFTAGFFISATQPPWNSKRACATGSSAASGVGWRIGGEIALGLGRA